MPELYRIYFNTSPNLIPSHFTPLLSCMLVEVRIRDVRGGKVPHPMTTTISAVPNSKPNHPPERKQAIYPGELKHTTKCEMFESVTELLWPRSGSPLLCVFGPGTRQIASNAAFPWGVGVCRMIFFIQGRRDSSSVRSRLFTSSLPYLQWGWGADVCEWSFFKGQHNFLS